MLNNKSFIAAFPTGNWSWFYHNLTDPTYEHTNHFMRNTFLVVLVTLASCFQFINAQCSFQEVEDGWTCETPVVLCSFNIDGYSGALPDVGQGPQPVTFCNGGGSIENAVWFSFIALSNTVTIEVIPANCTVGTSDFMGMQSAIYDDCDNNNTVACEGDGTENPMTLTANNFIPGNTYYLLLDGYGGSICDFTINAIEGVSDNTLTLDNGGDNVISSNESGSVCVQPDRVFSFEIPDCNVDGNPLFDFLYEDGYSCYDWTITPSTFDYIGDSNNPFIEVVFQEKGTYTISVEKNLDPSVENCAVGICDDPPSVELTVCFIDTIYEATFLCPGQFKEICGDLISSPGIYSCLDETNCVFTIDTITVGGNNIDDLGNIFLCADECFTLEGETYCEREDFLIQSTIDCALIYQFSIKDVSINITADDYPLLDCSGSEEVVSHSVSTNYDGQLIFEYQDSDFNVIGNQNFILLSSPGDYLFIVYGDGFEISCADTIAFTIEINNVEPDFLLTTETLTCANQNALVEIVTSESIVEYSWKGPAINGAIDGPAITVQDTGTYTLIVTGNNGCTGEQEIFVGSNYPDIDVTIDFEELDCNIAQTTLSYISSLVIDSVSWAGPNEYSETAENPIAQDTGIYTLKLFAQNGCDYTELFQILGNYTEPIFSSSLPMEWACETVTMDLEVDYDQSENYGQVWSTNGGVIEGDTDNRLVTIGAIGTYFVEVIDNVTGCSKFDTIIVSPNDEIPTEISLEVENPLCFDINDGRIELIEVVGGTGPFTFYLDGILQTSEVAENLAPAEYEVAAIDVNGCEIKRTIDIAQPTELVAEIDGPSDGIFGEDVTVSSIIDLQNFNISSINWFDEENNPLGSGDEITFTLEKNTIVLMEVTDENGCVVLRSIPIVLDEDYDYFVPTIFTPNDDGLNDIFAIYTQNLPGTIEEFYIYDRWGNKMFEVADIDNSTEPQAWGWDGRFNGTIVNPGVYSYYAVVETLGVEKKLSGSITIVK